MKKTPTTPANAAADAAFSAEMNKPRRIYCHHCGSPFNVRPDDDLRAVCTHCHSSLVMQLVKTKPAETDFTDKRQFAKFLWIAVASLYFVFQFLLRPTKWEIVYVDADENGRDGLYLKKSTYAFWGHASYKLHPQEDGSIVYFIDGKKHGLPEDVMPRPLSSADSSSD